MRQSYVPARNFSWGATLRVLGMGAVIEVGQRIQKAGRRVVGNGPRMGRERRFQKNGIGICRLELADVERGREVVREDAFANANRTIEFVVVEKTAATARREHGPVSKRRQRMGKTVVKTARALLEKIIGI